MISRIFGVFVALAAIFPMSASAAAPPPSSIDTSSVLDLEQSPEEKMVSEGLPATPESGAENPEDLLKSAPVIHSVRKPTKSASAKGSTGDGLPATLPLVPGSAPEANSRVAPPEALPPLPDTSLTEEPPPPTDELEAVVGPDAEAPASEERGTSTKKWDRSIPLYDRENPTWGFDLHGSIQALGTPIISEQQDTNGVGTGVKEKSDVRNFGMGFEYEPKFLQGIGVVALGPSFNMYVLEPQGDLTKSAFSIFSVGFSAKYQLMFTRGQFLVPFVGFETQMVRYSFDRADVGSGWTTASGPTFGALIALNWMEPSQAHILWSESGIRRSYLVAEFKDLQAGEDILSSDGQAIYFGLRMEY